jgi:hypothetical protein
VTRATAKAPGVRARYLNPYRLASYFLALYAFGHTLGAVAQTPRFGPESDAVVSTMRSVHVVVQGTDCTWYGFYEGSGIVVSVFFVLSAVLAWHLGGAPLRERRALAAVTWALFLAYAGNVAITWAYFFPTPVVFSGVVAAFLGFACVRDALAREARGARSS